MSAQTYESCIIEALSSKGMAQPNVILEIIHVQHQTSNTILQKNTTSEQMLIIERAMLIPLIYQKIDHTWEENVQLQLVGNLTIKLLSDHC